MAISSKTTCASLLLLASASRPRPCRFPATDERTCRFTPGQIGSATATSSSAKGTSASLRSPLLPALLLRMHGWVWEGSDGWGQWRRGNKQKKIFLGEEGTQKDRSPHCLLKAFDRSKRLKKNKIPMGHKPGYILRTYCAARSRDPRPCAPGAFLGAWGGNEQRTPRTRLGHFSLASRRR